MQVLLKCDSSVSQHCADRGRTLHLFLYMAKWGGGKEGGGLICIWDWLEINPQIIKKTRNQSAGGECLLIAYDRNSAFGEPINQERETIDLSMRLSCASDNSILHQTWGIRMSPTLPLFFLFFWTIERSQAFPGQVSQPQGITKTNLWNCAKSHSG